MTDAWTRCGALVVVAVLAGCAARPAPTPPAAMTDAAWGAQIKTKADPYTKVTTIQGGDIKAGQSAIHLRAAKSSERPDTPAKIVVYASLFYFGKTWAYFDRANTVDGRAWPVQSVRRDVFRCMSHNCSYGELVLVDIDAAYLRSKQTEGISLKIWGAGGEQVFAVPGPYITAFLAEIGS
ncbi:hypothetical protein [Xenophilus sp.]|uniref:hypothetical protein n=2 Tax=Xenophilus sp. TaxID=1873499 RepID=UPI0037DC7333